MTVLYGVRYHSAIDTQYREICTWKNRRMYSLAQFEYIYIYLAQKVRANCDSINYTIEWCYYIVFCQSICSVTGFECEQKRHRSPYTKPLSLHTSACDAKSHNSLLNICIAYLQSSQIICLKLVFHSESA